MKNTLLALITIFGATLANAQSTSDIQLHVGATNVHLKDKSFSALDFSGNATALDLRYERQKNKHLFAFTLGGNAGTLTYNDLFPTFLLDLELSGIYVRKLPTQTPILDGSSAPACTPEPNYSTTKASKPPAGSPPSDSTFSTPANTP